MKFVPDLLNFSLNLYPAFQMSSDTQQNLHNLQCVISELHEMLAGKQEALAAAETRK